MLSNCACRICLPVPRFCATFARCRCAQIAVVMEKYEKEKQNRKIRGKSKDEVKAGRLGRYYSVGPANKKHLNLSKP